MALTDARSHERCAPLGLRERVIVAGIAQLLERLHIPGDERIFRHLLILDEHQPAGFDHARGLFDELRHIVEVMRRDAARHQIESIALEGQMLRARLTELDVAHALTAHVCFRRLEHLRREVAGDDARNVRRKLQRRVPPPVATSRTCQCGHGCAISSKRSRSAPFAWVVLVT